VGSLADVDAVIAAEKTAKGKLMPIFQYRYGDGIQKAKRIVDAGIAGKAYVATSETHWVRGADYYAVPWRGKWATELGGVLMTHSIHLHDMLTYLTAREYIGEHHPSVLFLGFGETDECAHSGRYDLYLQQATDLDRMISDLWYYVQTDPYYKDSTTFLITTDHGRGWKPNKWTTHGFWAEGSGDIWMAVLGPDIRPEGELRSKGQVYQKQIAATIASLLGDPAAPGHPPGKAIEFPARPRPAEIALSPATPSTLSRSSSRQSR